MKTKSGSFGVAEFISGFNDNVAKLIDTCPKCAEIAVYLLQNVRTYRGKIEQEIGEDPTKYLDILEKQKVVYRESGNYLLTGIGEMVAKNIQIQQLGVRLDVEETTEGYKMTPKRSHRLKDFHV